MHWSGNHVDASLKEVMPVNINELNIDKQVRLGRGTSKNRSAASRGTAGAMGAGTGRGRQREKGEKEEGEKLRGKL